MEPKLPLPEPKTQWNKETEGWSNALKNEVLMLADGKLEAIQNLIHLVNLAREEATEKAQEDASDCDSCERRSPDEPIRDESRD